MSNSVRDNQDLLRNVQDTCDELDRKEIENSVLQKQKEDAEYVAKITTQANEELVQEIRELNYKTGLYGVSKKPLNLRNEYEQQCQPKQCPNFISDNTYNTNCSDCVNCRNNNACQNNKSIKNQDINIRFPWIDKHKSTFLLIFGFIIILLLATGFTPMGEFWVLLQDQWIELIANLFKLALVGTAGFLMYLGIKKK